MVSWLAIPSVIILGPGSMGLMSSGYIFFIALWVNGPGATHPLVFRLLSLGDIPLSWTAPESAGVSIRISSRMPWGTLLAGPL